MRVNNRLYIGNGSNQQGGSGANQWPLYITAWTNSTSSANPAERWGTGNSGDNWNGSQWGNCSARFNDYLICAAVISISDRRIKTNIETLPVDYCKDFVMSCTPVSYNLKKDLERGRNNTEFGFIAQELEQKGFGYIITYMDDDDPNLIEEIETIDGKEYKSPKGVKMSVAYQQIIPILSQNIKTIYLENTELKTKVELLNNTVESLNNTVDTLKSELEQIKALLLQNNFNINQ
jgi:hypothetical protein